MQKVLALQGIFVYNEGAKSCGEVQELGKFDIEARNYLSDNARFADIFNTYVFEGEQIIKPDQLKEMDSAEIVLPFGNDARVPIQKYRDLLKAWCAKYDENAVYVILGSEIQDKVNYGMPVKDGLYSWIGYSKQIDEAKKSYRKPVEDPDGEEDLIVGKDGNLRIRLEDDEFLSGLRKGDKLIPIISVVIFMSDEPWDGPRSLFDMLDVRDEKLYKYLNDYRLNLIVPEELDDEDLGKFHTELGFALSVIKHQGKDADKIIEATNHKKIDIETAQFVNAVTNLGLELVEEEGGVDMCLAMEKRVQKENVNGAIKILQGMGVSNDEIVSKVMENFDVTKEYVLGLMGVKTA